MNFLPLSVAPFFRSSLIVPAPAISAKVGNQSRCETMSFEIERAGILPGQRTMAGTR
ncbi:hypothetical protein D3C84_1277540 [compost metagenome]